MRRIRLGAWLVALMGLLVAAMTALAYTSGQAEAGRQVFATICSGCHGANLEGVSGPALIGPAFQAGWRNAGALFGFISQNMPLNAPGSLSHEQYWNVISFLLRRNGVAPDERPLDEQTAGQVQLRRGAAG